MKKSLIIFIFFILKLNAVDLDELYINAKGDSTLNNWSYVISKSIENNTTKYLEEAKTTLWNIMKKKDPLGLKALQMFGVNSKDDLPKFIMRIEKDKKEARERQKKIKKEKIKNKVSFGETLQVGILKITPKNLEIKTFFYIDTVSNQKTISKKLCINFKIENTSTTDTIMPIDSLFGESKVRNEYNTTYYDDTIFLISRGIKNLKYQKKLLPNKKFMVSIPFGFEKHLKGKDFSAEIQFIINNQKKREKIYLSFQKSDIN